MGTIPYHPRHVMATFTTKSPTNGNILILLIVHFEETGMTSQKKKKKVCGEMGDRGCSTVSPFPPVPHSLPPFNLPHNHDSIPRQIPAFLLYKTPLHTLNTSFTRSRLHQKYSQVLTIHTQYTYRKTHHFATTFLAAVASVPKEQAGSEYHLTSATRGPSTNLHNTWTGVGVGEWMGGCW